MAMLRLFRREKDRREECFNIETSLPLTDDELAILKRILAYGFVGSTVCSRSELEGLDKIVEIGPRLNFATAFHTNVQQICRSVGINKVVRIERSIRWLISEKNTAPNPDRMTQFVYDAALSSFQLSIAPEPVKNIPLTEQGPDALKLPGLAMDQYDREFYHRHFVVENGRNPTDVEMQDLNNANSEHSRHGYFKGIQIIDGAEMPETLLEIIQSTLRSNPRNSVIAFRDNSSGIAGYDIWTIVPEHPGQSSRFVKDRFRYNIIFTAETHNFPTGIAPVPGAETGTGGRIRDIQATGRGGLVIAGTAGYCVGALNIPGYRLQWEETDNIHPVSLAKPLVIEIGASDGASDYGNKFGEPVIQGFTRSFDQRLPDGERWAWLKPIMFTGGVGQMDDGHTEKGSAAKGLLIVQVGGPAYRIGVGGGAASSLLQGENEAALDFNAVQRGDAEMEQKMNRVVRACIEMGERNPIVSIHDQGAGGPANVLKELVEKAGGRIELRRINAGDPTMSVLEIWIAEYQERNGFLIHPDNIEEFRALCCREKVNCEVLGEVTGDGIFTVHDEQNDSCPVELDLAKVLGNLPQKTFYDRRISPKLETLSFHEDLTFEQALKLVLSNLSVGSKRFLANKVDRSVTGLIARQQCCGPLQLTVSDVSVVAQSHFGHTGAAIAIGEQPIKMLVNPAAGARMAVGEAMTNIVWVRLSSRQDIKCSVNWMWAPKLPGEGAAMYDAARAMRDLMVGLGIAADGGKDSLSMATKVGDEIVKSPRQMVVSAYCTVPDVRQVVTPDFKRPGSSRVLYLPLSKGTRRLGGSALAQSFKQVGDKSPDVDDPGLLLTAFDATQRLIKQGLILAGHDISDGGLVATLCEMAFAGNCGFRLDIQAFDHEFAVFFAEELGLVIEVDDTNLKEVFYSYDNLDVPVFNIGRTTADGILDLSFNTRQVLKQRMEEVRSWWEETSHQIERLQIGPELARDEKLNIYSRQNPVYYASFVPERQKAIEQSVRDKLPVAILREEGSNGDREMASAFYAAGFRPYDVNMMDLLDGRVTLDRFRGMAAVGGFSFADYPDSAKGWASVIRENPMVWSQFQEFFARTDTFSLGVCNGCQLFALLGLVPWPGILPEHQPRFTRNVSSRFESRWSTVRVLPSPAIMFKGMEDSVLGIWVAHGEGKLDFPSLDVYLKASKKELFPLAFVNDRGYLTEEYPFNPNGSPGGLTAICTPDGRHLAMMPHPERCFRKWQWSWMSEKNDRDWPESPWLKLFQNAFDWCMENK